MQVLAMHGTTRQSMERIAASGFDVTKVSPAHAIIPPILWSCDTGTRV